MLRLLFISIVIVISFISCRKDSVVESFDYEKDTPKWLKEKIDTMSAHQEYFGTKVFRYKCNERFIYHIIIPISSCYNCEVYDHAGNRVHFPDENAFQEYLNTRKDETLIWEWKEIE